MTLYLKYRPQKIDELDLESVREQLKKIVASKSIPHAFLFSGPKGAGKTSAARILAKIVNCSKLGKDGEPCNECESCLSISKGTSMDVVEIDAASNRGIDDIRALKENIMLSPSSSSKKIYIVDEAHMLTTEASNAFLKTLEEPPAHAIFILATTDPGKLPDTVRSRLVNVNFRKASDTEIARQIERVAKGEGVEIDKDAVVKISKIADGSFRDAVKTFEQLIISVGNKIKQEDVDSYLMSGKIFKIDELVEIITKKDIEKILSYIKRLSDEGVSMRNVLDSLIEKTRGLILEPDMVYLIELLIEAKGRMKDAFIEELPLEIALIKFCSPKPKNSDEVRIEVEIGESQSTKTNTPEKKLETMAAVPTKETTVAETSKVEPQVVTKVVGAKVDAGTWRQVLVIAKTKNASVEGLLRASEPMDFDGARLVLGVYYKFHKERLELPQNKRILEDVLTQVFSTPISVIYELTERKFTPPVDKPLTTAKDKDIISAAKEIFGN